MQSILVYGRILARAFATGINNEFHPWSNPSQIQKPQHKNLHLVTATSGISKTHSPAQILKKWSFGDDACFVARHKLTDVIGVADGVGGWRTYGVDPAQFPKSLMTTCERMVREGHFTPSHPANIIAASYYEMMENKAPLIGSCTACLVALHNDDKKLYTANLGDSGFLIIRDGEIVQRSEEQQHYFNTPFQLAVAPTSLQGFVLADSPESAESSSFAVEEGDIILLGTDGLFDNMNEDTILHHISKLKDHKLESIQRVANNLAEHAHELAFDPDYMSPFALNAGAHGIDIKGGKPDDITVLLSTVTHLDGDT